MSTVRASEMAQGPLRQAAVRRQLRAGILPAGAGDEWCVWSACRAGCCSIEVVGHVITCASQHGLLA
eukprot:930-Eustigmatos_ZCMA.PRE.1